VHGRSPRLRPDAASAGSQATTHASAGNLSTDHAESRAVVFLARGPIANSHPIRRVAVHNLGTRGRLPRPAAPARGRPRRPARTAIRWTRVGSRTNEPSQSWRDWEGSPWCGQAGDDPRVKSRWLDRGFPRPPPALRRSLS
jgi:hypothetical protein